MWRQLYEKLKQQRRERNEILNPKNARVPALDGGFFEKLGDLLKRHAEMQGRSPRPAARSAGGGDERPSEDRISFPVPEDADAPPGPEDSAQLLSDALSSNIEALYVKIVLMVLHSVGSNGIADVDQDSMFAYMQAAFKFDDEKHNDLLDRARAKEAPKILLHVEIVEGRDIKPMDVNGLSDTFCTLYLTSAKDNSYNTSIKIGTLNPEWKEHFCLPVENPSEDILCVEAWDFDPAETVREKVMKIGDVKGIRGWGKLVHEFGSTGKNENEFIGSTLISLNSIRASGEIRWCDIERSGRTGKRGSIKLKLAFSSENNTEAAFKDYRHLVRLLFLYELDNTKIEPYCWNGNYVTLAETVLIQHLVQSGLFPTMDPLVRWVEYCRVHMDHPISFEVFSFLLKKLVPYLQNNLFDKEKEILFWEASKTLLLSCFNGIKKLHTMSLNDKNTHQMEALLRILSLLRYLKLPEKFKLFPFSLYGWLQPSEDIPTSDVVAVSKLSIIRGVDDWYDDMIGNNIINYHNSSGEIRLNHLIKIVKHAIKDVHNAIKTYDMVFQEHLQLSYAHTLYSAHGDKIPELVVPVVEEIYQILKPLKFHNQSSSESDDDALSLGMQLFDLYLTLKEYVSLGSGLSLEEEKEHKVSEYYCWFQQSVSLWLDISLWKALKRITKAIELDELVPVIDSVKYSTSAVDTLTIFNQIKIFWHQLSWPHAEGSYIFIAKIVDDICQCSVHYADNMSQRIEDLKDSADTSGCKFEVSNEWCLAINNIEYIWNSIEPFVNSFGMKEIVQNLFIIDKKRMGSEQCGRTLQLVIDNTLETVGTKITELLQTVADKMMPVINKFLLEGAEMHHKGESHVVMLTQYLDKNLITLHSELNSEIFQQMLLIIWVKVATRIFQIVESSVEEKRTRTYFCNLQKTLEILVDFFSGGDALGNISNVEALKEAQKVLTLHSTETSQLIHYFYLERLEEQKSMESSPWGIITICTEFVGDLLRIQVLSGRNLHPMDSNGSSDPYIEISLLPAEKFLGVQKQKTKTHKKTLFPLFDETFSIKLTPVQRATKEGMVLFTVKDKDFIGNDFGGEAFLCFSDIEIQDSELQQIHLKLSVPKNLDSQVSKALQLRKGDKIAKEFIKKQNLKARAQ